MPFYIIRTAQRQTAYYEYRVDAPTTEIAQSRVRAGEESGNNYETDYETELIESCEEEQGAD
jgi:hypothetical protein